MAELIIETSNQKVFNLLSEMAEQLGATIIKQPSVIKQSKTPNAETIKAIEAARKGQTKPITNFKSFFDSI